VNSWPAWLLLVSLVPHRVLAAGGSPSGMATRRGRVAGTSTCEVRS